MGLAAAIRSVAACLLDTQHRLVRDGPEPPLAGHADAALQLPETCRSTPCAAFFLAEGPQCGTKLPVGPAKPMAALGFEQTICPSSTDSPSGHFLQPPLKLVAFAHE